MSRVRVCRAIVLCVAIHGTTVAAQDADDFEKYVRPVLTTRCVKCHGPSEASGGLRLDSRAALLRGGESGPAVRPGRPDHSLLVAAIRRDSELAMPPDSPLTARQVAALTQWIAAGAEWPASVVLKAPPDAPHWAFQPIANPRVPDVDKSRVLNPVDAFVLRRAEGAKVRPAPRADRRTLLRRATFDLIGLPPTQAEIDAFVRDTDRNAWQKVVDRLLQSPHYGEKWGRHWLDVARYSDSKGYVYGREERFWVHAATYRDWVVRALNDDMPYNRFLLLQIAADGVDAPKPDLAAMGFLTLGRRFLGVTHDIIDDRIDVVTRGTMGLTVACARCHDHKYDPIPTGDYYSLYGVFRNSVERLVPLAEPTDAESEFAKELRKREARLREQTIVLRKRAADRVRGRVGDYLLAQLELHKYPEQGFDQILLPDDIIPEFVRRWRDYLHATGPDDPVFAAWHRFRELPDREFADQAAEICARMHDAKSRALHPAIARAFATPPSSMRQVASRYDDVFRRAVRSRKANDSETDESDLVLQVLYGADSPCEVPDEPIVNTEQFFTTAECTELWKLRGEVDRWLRASGESPPYALILNDRRNITDARVLVRGNPATPGERVPRQFVSALTGDTRQPFASGSGRLELAQAIVDPENPLTARVAVNRVWMHHFGNGLVRTPSDFGRRAEPPTHPDLLDWLARSFVEGGWSLKKLHRLIMTSATYQQSSARFDASLEESDPENRLLARMSSRRLSFEEFRDAALAVAGTLNREIGGQAVDLFGSPRRTIYATIDRQFFPPILRAFDVANPDLHVARRSETTVPQQALFVLNHTFVLEQANALADSGSDLPDGERVRQLYRAVLQRDPTATEIDDAVKFVTATDVEVDADAVVAEWSYGYGEFHEGTQRVREFRNLPWFDGRAWQGGAKWPDPMLGWVQLTAAGGHAGNDRQHAAIRRWTAPAAMRVQIESALKHPVPQGDGVRGFLVSSRGGLLHHAEIHNRVERFDIEQLDVEAGETLDFVVDLREGLNHEEFDWPVSIKVLNASTEPGDEQRSVWQSQKDFSGTPTQRLGPWAQLAQVLLASNEFLFVD